MHHRVFHAFRQLAGDQLILGVPGGAADGIGAAGEGVIPAIFRKEKQILSEHHGKHAAFKCAGCLQAAAVEGGMIMQKQMKNQEFLEMNVIFRALKPDCFPCCVMLCLCGYTLGVNARDPFMI